MEASSLVDGLSNEKWKHKTRCTFYFDVEPALNNIQISNTFYSKYRLDLPGPVAVPGSRA